MGLPLGLPPPLQSALTHGDVGVSAAVTGEATEKEGGDVPKGRSKLVHDLLNRSDAVFISFDLETAGEDVGIVQVSAEVFRLDLV